MNFVRMVFMLMLSVGSMSGMGDKAGNKDPLWPFQAMEDLWPFRTTEDALSDNDFDALWPFEKLGTKYDDVFARLAPALHASNDYLDESWPNILQNAHDYLSGASANELFPETIKAALDSCKGEKKQALKIISYVFRANAEKRWSSAHPLRLLDPARSRAIIAYHGLGDNSHSFQNYVQELDGRAITFVPDFLDHTNKPLRIGTQLELLMAAYQYFIAQQKLKALDRGATISHCLGVSRGGGVVARLSSKFKQGHEPTAGFVMLAPFINPPATISHIARETSIASTGWGILLPQWSTSSFIGSANASCSSLVEIDIKQPAAVKLNQALLILHGSKDRTIPYKESKKWAQKHAKLGNAIYYKTLPGLGHNDIFADQECVNYTRDFLNNSFERLKELQLPQQ